MTETLGCPARSLGGAAWHEKPWHKERSFGRFIDGAEQQLRTDMGKTLISVAVVSLALVVAFAGLCDHAVRTRA